jgi:hypothetical protein
MRRMKTVSAVLGTLFIGWLAGAAMAQDAPCMAAGKQYSSGTTVCMRGFEQQCVNGSWANQQRFCSEDTQFEIIREPNVAEPPAGGANQPGVPAADKPADVVVPQE